VNDFEVSTIVFPNLYGPLQKSTQLIPYIMRCIQKKQTEIYIGSKKGNRNFLFVDDASRALEAVLLHPSSSRDIYFSGNNENISTILSIITQFTNHENGLHITFVEKTGKKPRTKYSAPPESLEDAKERKYYNWSPLINIKEGLKVTVRSYLEND
jgi:nucleoside-diphosphate-sugar epimerase